MYRLIHAIGTIALVFVLQSCTTPTIVGAITVNEEIPGSPSDDREYRYLRLSNELQVVLISDPDTDRSAASLSVFRGNYADPDEYPGLAHFLEHMLFIGTKKYPESDGYFQFVQAHGGSSNAYTAPDHTNYFFDIDPDFFREGLDRFAQFFISPSLEPAYVDREKNAVDSEYRFHIKEDAWRGMMAGKVAYNPDHPISKFSVGSLETLDDSVHAALVEFFKSEYSANQMGLVALSNQPLNKMVAWIVPIFLAIENRNLPPFATHAPLFLPGQLPATLTHRSLQQNYSVGYQFPMPLLETHYKKKPADYLSNLLGHEGEGSLHSSLIKRGWITYLSAGPRKIDNNTSVLSMDVGLTPEGRNQIPQITDLLFDYIDMLSNQEPEEWRYREQAIVADLGFRFQEEYSPIGTVSAISPDLANFPAEDLLVHPYLMEEFDKELIKSYLTYLTPENVLMEVVGPDVETTDVERWFEVAYALSPGAIPVVPVTPDDLHLPAPNQFLPEDLSVGEKDDAGPQIAFDDGTVEMWLDRDNAFGVPRSTLNVSLRCEDGLISLQDVVFANLYRRIVSDDLTALSYPAFISGVGYDLAAPPKGFRISTFGYNDKQLVLLDAVLASFRGLEIRQDRFDVLKANMLRNLRNRKSELPYLQVRSAMNDLLLSSSWEPEDQAKFLEAVTLAQLNEWRARKLAAVDVMAMVHGNVDQSDVTELREVISKHLTLRDITPVKPKIRELDRAYLHEVEIDHNDGTIVLRVQDADDSFNSRAKSALMTHLLNSAFFTSIRTEQQLGYAVGMFGSPVYYRGGVTFFIQSPVTPPDVLEQKVIEFVDKQIGVISRFKRSTFSEHKAGLISLFTETDKNLSERSDRYWRDLDQGVTTFDSNQRIADEIGGLTIEEMTTFIKEIRHSLENNRILVFNRGQFDSGPINGVRL